MTQIMHLTQSLILGKFTKILNVTEHKIGSANLPNVGY